MRLNAVHTGARLQVPYAQKSVLRTRSTAARIETRDRATVSVKRKLQIRPIQLEHLQLMILSAREQNIPGHLHARDGLLMPLVLCLYNAFQLLPVNPAVRIRERRVVVKVSQTARRSRSDVSWKDGRGNNYNLKK